MRGYVIAAVRAFLGGMTLEGVDVRERMKEHSRDSRSPPDEDLSEDYKAITLISQDLGISCEKTCYKMLAHFF